MYVNKKGASKKRNEKQITASVPKKKHLLSRHATSDPDKKRKKGRTASGDLWRMWGEQWGAKGVGMTKQIKEDS